MFVLIGIYYVNYTNTQNYKHINNNIDGDVTYLKELRELCEVKVEVKTEIVDKKNKANIKDQLFKVTAYDLSVQSCGKSRGSKGYGITATGFDLKGHTWDSARVISVDPRVIPLNSKVYIEFVDDNYKKYNNYYYAVDKGGGIIGKHIDFFIGDFQSEKPSKEALKFGKTTAYVKIINEGDKYK